MMKRFLDLARSLMWASPTTQVSGFVIASEARRSRTGLLRSARNDGTSTQHVWKAPGKALILLLGIIAIPLSAAAQEAPTAPPPHPMAGPMGQMASGRIVGDVFAQDASGKRTLLPSQVIHIIVFQNGAPVLKLEKSSDAQGKFEFKNIFKDPSFEYALETAHEGKHYVMLHLHLEEGEDVIETSFRVGEGSPYLMAPMPPEDSEEGPAAPMGGAMPPSAAPSPARMGGADSEHADFSTSDGIFRKVAIGLSAVVLLAAFYFMSTGQQRKRVD